MIMKVKSIEVSSVDTAQICVQFVHSLPHNECFAIHPCSDSTGAAAAEEKRAFLNGSSDVAASKVDIVGTKKGKRDNFALQAHF